MDIDITELFDSIDPARYSASMFELGQDADIPCSAARAGYLRHCGFVFVD